MNRRKVFSVLAGLFGAAVVPSITKTDQIDYERLGRSIYNVGLRYKQMKKKWNMSLSDDDSGWVDYRSGWHKSEEYMLYGKAITDHASLMREFGV